MPLNKLDNFIKNTEGRILYVSPSDLDSTDSITNQGNSLARPFKTLQRALIESARFSFLKGNSNDLIERTTILLMPGDHVVDNRPGYTLKNVGNVAKVVPPSGSSESIASDILSLKLDSNFDLTQEDNVLYKFNSVYGGVVVPRGTSIVGLDLRKTKIKPKYVPNPTDSSVLDSAIFRITGGCYFWQFSIFDGDENGLVYTDSADFSDDNKSKPVFSHHKLTCFEYADGVNQVTNYELTDLDMYYAKLSNAYNPSSGRDITEKYPEKPYGFEKQRPEWEIVGAFASDPITISAIEAGSGGTPDNEVTVTCATDHGLQEGTPIKIENVSPPDYNISTKVQSVSVVSPRVFTYLLPEYRRNLETPGSASGATVTVETDTVTGSSPYIFNCSLRSVYGLCGMKADGAKASGFKSMVVAQFTGVSLQKDDRSFVKYNKENRAYEGISTTKKTGSSLSNESASTNSATTYHLDSGAVYRKGWETAHIRMINDAILQIVSVFAIGYNKHFAAETGGDASITNSNSNFGQLSLTSTGFKKKAFDKDNKAFVTNVIAPKAITATEEDIDWVSVDVGVTTDVGNNKRLYLYGYTNEDIIPPVISQGYRIGAKLQEKLYVDFSAVTGYGISEANILMSNESSSSVNEYKVVVGPASNMLQIGSNTIEIGEKIRLRSDDGDLPENIEPETVYYAIPEGDDSRIYLASSKTDAENNIPIKMYGGTNLTVISRVSDKSGGESGHPVQWDISQKQWYVNANAGNEIYTAINQVGIQTSLGLDASTETSYVKRIADARSLDEKIYKLRMVIPKELPNSKNPESGFIIQESSTTGVRSDTDFNLRSITLDDYEYNRNPRFIGSCTFSAPTVSVRAELPHDLNVGDQILIKDVKDSTNPVGSATSGYNGTYTVASVPNQMEFTYTSGRTLGPAFTNDIHNRSSELPRYERNDIQSNLYIYRNEIISPYIDGQQDGIYHAYALKSDTAVPVEFTDYEYSQNVADLYPQQDRDNIDDDPSSAESFALRSPLGKVVTNDLKKSLTRTATETFVSKLNKDLTVSSEGSLSGGKATLTFTKDHGLSGIVTGTITGGSGHTDGTYYNVKLWNEVGLSSWNGATAVVGVSGNAVNMVDIQSPGSGYSDGDVLYIDKNYTGGSTANATYTVATAGLTGSILFTGSCHLQSGVVAQVTGIGTTATNHYRAVAVPGSNSISIAKTSGDPISNPNQNVIFVAPVGIVTSASYSSTTDLTTVVCPYAHGLVAGNKFKLTDSSDNLLGNYLVKSRVGVNTFTVSGDITASADNGYILKHGLSSKDGISDKRAENIASRGMSIYSHEALIFDSEGSDNTKLKVSSPTAGIGTGKRFELASYIQIDDEIMRVSSDTLSGIGGNELTVLRGVLGTGISTHDGGSLIRRVNPVPVEFRRPSIIRASGHTFEYLGYGPGNYSTGLPQVQVKTLTEEEEYLSQSQERAAGIVVYTGMNSKGDFYIGNTRKSSATGEETSFDVPIPTVTGEEPSNLNAVFDELLVKERIVVEGGDSKQILSEFDGPVTFNNKTKFNEQIVVGSIKVTDPTHSSSKTTGALVVTGGVGIGGTVNIGDDSDIKLRDEGLITLGNSDDLQIYYTEDLGPGNPTESRIISTAESMRIKGDDILFEDGDGTNLLKLNADGSVALYHNGNGPKLETSGVGVTITDQLDVGVLINAVDAVLTGGLNVTGIVTASGFQGSFTGDVTGSSSQITVASNSADTLAYPVFVADETGNKEPRTNPNLNFNARDCVLSSQGLVVTSGDSSAGIVTAVSFDGSIAASNIDSGTLADARIPNLNASKITAGTFNIARLGSGTADGTKFLKDTGAWETVPIVTINNNADNRVITGDTAANTLNGESNLTFDSSTLTLTGQFKPTTAADNTPAIIAKNTGGVDSVIQRWVGETDNLELQNCSAGDYEITNTGQNNGIRFYDGANGVMIIVNDNSILHCKEDIVEVGNGTQEPPLSVHGDIIAFYTSSDKKLKDNITPIDDPLAKVLSISGNTFTWKEGNELYEGEDTGVVAQEIEALGLPGIVKDQKSGHKSVQYHKLVPLLIEAVKELSAKVDNLEQKLSDK